MASPSTVVIIGGGFAGVNVAQRLERALARDWDVVLFSQENHHVFTPLLGDVVGAAINPMHVVWPIRQMVRRVICHTATVIAVDRERKEVVYHTAAGREARQAYTHLVLACGSQVNLNIIPGMAAHGWPLKTMGDALVLRNHLIGQLEKAHVEPDALVRKWLASVVVVGGGFSGVEVAGEIADLLLESRRYYPRIAADEIKVTLLHSRDRILPELSAKLAEFAQTKMRKRGIDIRLNAAAAAVTEKFVRLKTGDEVIAGTVVCTIGTTVNPLIPKLQLPSEKNRLLVDADMRVKGTDDIWSLGDCAQVPNARDGQPCPPTAQFAVRQAKHLAANIAAIAEGKTTTPFSFKPVGAFASIGNRRAVGEVYGLRFSGLPAWLMWRGIYLSKMPTFARKVQIAFDWLWQLFFPRDIVELNLGQTERMHEAHYEAGQYVFHKGDPGDRFFVIQRGRAGVYIDEGANAVKVLGTGEFFGEVALLGGVTRTASVKAEEPLDVLVVNRASFAQLTKHFSSLRTLLEAGAKQAMADDARRDDLAQGREDPK